MRDDIRELVLKAIQVIHEHADQTEDELVQHLVNAGATLIEAEKLNVFVPMAFGHAFLTLGGFRHLPTAYSVRAADGQWRARPLSAEPIYSCAFDVAVGCFKPGGIPEEVFKSVTMRSADLDAISHARAAGTDINELKETVFASPLVFGLQAEACATQEPKTWFGRLLNWLDG